jgi:hypothetical protein
MWSRSCILVRHVALDVDCSTDCRGRIRILRLHPVSLACDKTRSAFARRQFEGSRLGVEAQGTDRMSRTPTKCYKSSYRDLRKIYSLAIQSSWVLLTSPAAHRREGHAAAVEGRSDSATSSNRMTANPSRRIGTESDGVVLDHDAGVFKADGSWLDGGRCWIVK